MARAIEGNSKLKRAQADPVIAPDNGQVLWGRFREGPSIAHSSGVNISMIVFCYLSLREENEKILVSGLCGGDMCTAGATVHKEM